MVCAFVIQYINPMCLHIVEKDKKDEENYVNLYQGSPDLNQVI